MDVRQERERGGTERGDSLVKEGWYTSNYSEENSDLP